MRTSCGVKHLSGCVEGLELQLKPDTARDVAGAKADTGRVSANLSIAQILVELPSASQEAAILAPRPAEQQEMQPAMPRCLGECLQQQWFALTPLNVRPEGFNFKIRNWFYFQLGSPNYGLTRLPWDDHRTNF